MNSMSTMPPGSCLRSNSGVGFGCPAYIFRRIATTETDVEVGTVDDWEWRGPTPEFAGWAERLGEPRLAERAADGRLRPPPVLRGSGRMVRVARRAVAAELRENLRAARDRVDGLRIAHIGLDGMDLPDAAERL